ncbi:MAG: UDP-2,3-diacylglucosamine diphosphatase [Bdellovibrio sp.]
MSISIISDIHAAFYNPSGNDILSKFLKNKTVLKSNKIIFLGDIFDFMVGNYFEYLDMWNEFFSWIEKQQHKCEIHFVEGNHDFHLESLFNQKGFKINYHKEGFTLNVNNRILYVEHGDDLEIDNNNYQRYKKIIRSNFVKKIANPKIIPFNLALKIGTSASLRSRNIEEKYAKFTDDKLVKEKFRISFLKKCHKLNVQGIICGHGHIKDYFESNGVFYANNGYAPVSKTFIHYDQNELQFIEL